MCGWSTPLWQGDPPKVVYRVELRNGNVAQNEECYGDVFSVSGSWSAGPGTAVVSAAGGQTGFSAHAEVSVPDGPVPGGGDVTVLVRPLVLHNSGGTEFSVSGGYDCEVKLTGNSHGETATAPCDEVTSPASEPFHVSGNTASTQTHFVPGASEAGLTYRRTISGDTRVFAQARLESQNPVGGTAEATSKMGMSVAIGECVAPPSP